MCSKCEQDAATGGDPDDPVVVQQWRDQQRAWFRDTIHRHGWAIQFVSGEGRIGDAGFTPSFGYTVGLWGYGHPEIVVFGTDSGSASGLLNQLGARVRDGVTMRDGDEIAVHGAPVRLFDLPIPGAVIFTANDYYDRPPYDSVPAVQAVYPDADGVWPWEPDCQLRPELQPMPGTFLA